MSDKKTEFTQKQKSVIKAFQKAYDRFEELGLRAHAAVDMLYVIRTSDWKAYDEQAEQASASECLNWMDTNDLPNHLVGYVEGVGD